MTSDERRYVAAALMADLMNRHHHVRAASEEEAERRIRKRYPDAVAVLVRHEDSRRRAPSRFGPRPLRRRVAPDFGETASL